MTSPALTPAQQQLLDAIRVVAAWNVYNTAAGWDIEPVLGRKPTHAELLSLVAAGKVSAVRRVSKTKGTAFLVWRPRREDVVPLPCTAAAARARLADVLDTVRPADGPARYEDVRDRFLWFDWRGNDLFEPVARSLAGPDGPYRFADDGRRFDSPEFVTHVAPPVIPGPPDDELSDDDFRLLNALETEEARRINFGAFETAIGPDWLARATNRPEAGVRAALDRLAAHQYLLWLGGEAVRSRMAELARELRYVKQRFTPDDADRRPYLVRAVQVRTVPRRKPVRDRELAPAVGRLKQTLAAVPHAAAALDAVHGMLRAEWGDPVVAAGFQLLALELLLPAYLGATAVDTAVFTADTGSGKTEAALLPLIAGAAADRLAGRRGVKAVLVYPRVRLAYNQAQRLVKSLAQLAAQPGGVMLTVGLQSKDVPGQSHAPAAPEPGGGWEPWPGDPTAGFEFPLFGCPACGKKLRMHPGGGADGHDRLICGACPWAFAGWAVSKARVRREPPDFFLPVAESLHQWLHDPAAGRLFGDRPEFLPPRALLADEIHLYSYIQGAQIGYTLRRLLARAELNARPGDTRPARPLAVGMSATLGEPSAVWGRLTGRPDPPEVAPRGEAGELRENPRGWEHFYFVQPEVESRGQAVAVLLAAAARLCCREGRVLRPGERHPPVRARRRPLGAAADGHPRPAVPARRGHPAARR